MDGVTAPHVALGADEKRTPALWSAWGVLLVRIFPSDIPGCVALSVGCVGQVGLCQKPYTARSCSLVGMLV